MNNDFVFKTEDELFNGLMPALRSKARELHLKGLKYIHEEDIWNFLKKKKWFKAHNLDLGSIVNDIFNVNERALDDYVQNEIKEIKRKVEKN